MDRKIGEIFEYDGVRLKIVEHKDCIGCYFKDSCMAKDTSIGGRCSPLTRSDHKSIIFIKVSPEQTKFKLSIRKKKITLNFN